ncbi:MAG: hypothetical protein KA210_03535 [Bacteroidia bacterium]|nr:hypothetical protein [Bacteroidia bacterium]
MIFKHKIGIYLLILFSYQFALAQENQIQKDTSKGYRAIEKYSKKRKFTKFIHKLIFHSVETEKVTKSNFQKTQTKNYLTFEGKIIRNIEIKTLDPFGYSDTDTTKLPKKIIEKVGNSLHVKTKQFAIKNLLLIKKNVPLDSLLMKESERIIRSQRFARSVSSEMKLVAQDSVDVFITILDSWSLAPDVSPTTTKTKFYLKEKNIFGLGHELANSYTKSLTSKQFGYSFNYFVPTIKNSFISTRLKYEIDFDRNYDKSVTIERPFFSAYTKWAGGIQFGQNLSKINALDANKIQRIQNSKYNYQEYWTGRSFRINKGNSEYDRTTNFITSARYFNKNYSDTPFISSDSLRIYAVEKLYLITLGITSRKFTQDKYIFNFNVVEDVASGFVYSITSGYQKKYDEYKFYAGGKMALGRFYKFGYLSSNLEFGTFLDFRKTNQTATSLQFIYFTNLQEYGKWKFRYFIKPQLIVGNNRLNTIYDKLSLNEDRNGIEGFNSNTLFGTKKLLITLQSQGYSPWRFLGFRLNPYMSYTAGMLGHENIGFSKSKLYSQFSMGLIISNDFLVFNSFQFSLSYYPSIPDGNPMLKTNAFSTSDFGLQNFEISKPSIIGY